MKSVQNLDRIPMLKEQDRICEWFTEIINTYPSLEFDPQTMQPTHFSVKTTMPFQFIDYKIKRPSAPECQNYLKHIDFEIQKGIAKGMTLQEVITDPDRKFLKLVNQCGSFKSAYSQNFLNHVHYINAIKGINMHADFLDNYQTLPDPTIF